MTSLPNLANSSSDWRRTILFTSLVWFTTRATFLLIGAYSFRLQGQHIPWTAMWIRWDANYYMSIATEGYKLPEVVTGLETGESNINFFPLLPLLIGAIHVFVPSAKLSALAAANFCLIVAGFAIHRLALRRFDRSAADWSVLSLMLVPGSFAMSGPFSESPFLMLSIGAAYLANINRGASTFLSAMLTITRWTGVLQGIGFALDWLMDRVRRREATYRRLLLICLIPIPLLAFLVYMARLTGDGLAPLHSNVGFWHQSFGWPFNGLFLFTDAAEPRFEVQSGLALCMVLLTLSQAAWLSWGEIFFVVASVASFTSSSAIGYSLIRYMIGLYPLHLAMGRLCGRYDLMRLLMLSFALIGAALALLWFEGSNYYV